jgi:hypothetical protein
MNQPVLEPSVVIYLDLLGFRDRMMSVAHDREESQKLLTEYQEIVVPALHALVDREFDIFQFKGFTDNIVLGARLSGSDDAEAVIGTATIKVAQFQLELARKGWFVRGGIATDFFYMDETIVFGSGLINAYDLESKIARDPRVVLDDLTLDLVRRFLKYYADPYHDAPQNGYVLVDTDGRGFVNYLYAPRGFDASFDEISSALLDHKRAVEAALVETAGRPLIWSKYRWVATYHNFFCDTWIPDELLEQHKISTEVLSTGPSLLVPNPAQAREE